MKPLSMIDELVSRHKVKGVEQERVDIIHESKRLEQEYLNNNISHEKYEQEKKLIHEKLIILDMEKMFYDVDDKLNEFLEEQKKSLKLNNERTRQLESLLSKKNLAEDNIMQARKIFYREKFDAESFKKLLKEKQTEIMELESEIFNIYKKQAEDKAKEMEIMLNTQIELKKHLAEEMAGDISLQVPDSGDSELPVFEKDTEKNAEIKPKKSGRRERIDVPKHHDTEVNEPRRLRRKHRRVV
tara:strand:- start:2824 stop:3549 length:726 start_codon:yes stop_codon:yes gene_type:complete